MLRIFVPEQNRSANRKFPTVNILSVIKLNREGLVKLFKVEIILETLLKIDNIEGEMLYVCRTSLHNNAREDCRLLISSWINITKYIHRDVFGMENFITTPFFYYINKVSPHFTRDTSPIHYGTYILSFVTYPRSQGDAHT